MSKKVALFLWVLSFSATLLIEETATKERNEGVFALCFEFDKKQIQTLIWVVPLGFGWEKWFRDFVSLFITIGFYGKLNNLIKEHVDTLVNNYSDVTEVINIDDFSSGNKGWMWG